MAGILRTCLKASQLSVNMSLKEKLLNFKALEVHLVYTYG